MSYRILVPDSRLDRPAWLAARQTGVTATDVARLARGGAGTWAAVRAEKDGTARDFHNSAMQHGTDREGFIADYALSAFGITPCHAVVAADDNPRYLASPDGVGDEEVGEYKTTVHDWAVLSDAPGRYIDQTLWQMRVTGRRRGRLVFEPHENGVPLYPFPRDFVIEWDAARVAELEAVADEFLSGPGEADENAAELDALLTARVEAKDAADVAAAKVAAYDEQIRELVHGQPTKFEGSLANLTLSAGSITHKFDSTALKQADPDTFNRFVKASPVKGRLTITARTAA